MPMSWVVLAAWVEGSQVGEDCGLPASYALSHIHAQELALHKWHCYSGCHLTWAARLGFGP